jgi:hypothetical protein
MNAATFAGTWVVNYGTVNGPPCIYSSNCTVEVINPASSGILTGSLIQRATDWYGHVWVRTQAANGTTWGSWYLQTPIPFTCTLSSGACAAQSLGIPMFSQPACSANSTGTGTLSGILKLPLVEGGGYVWSVTPTSTVGTDSATVSGICVGNPG